MSDEKPGSSVSPPIGDDPGRTALVRGTEVADLGNAGDGWSHIRVVETGLEGYMASRFLALIER